MTKKDLKDYVERVENALLTRMVWWKCPDCKANIRDDYKHELDCRHYITEREVEEKRMERSNEQI